MKIDFNNLRLKLAKDFNRLVFELNELNEKEQLWIEDPLYDLREGIGALLLCESSSDDIFDSLDYTLSLLDKDIDDNNEEE